VQVLEGLGEIVEGSTPHAADGALDAGMAGHDHDLHLGALRLHPLQDVETALPVQHQIDEHHTQIRMG
jgi:hypothetical protein